MHSRIRVIGGHLRGSNVDVPLIEGLRPTGSRIRETLFNWLNPWINQANCLDAFAGSGILGIEAISRNAKNVTFLEASKPANQQLQNCLKRLKVNNSQVHLVDSEKWLNTPKHTKFDLVFIDPPFKHDIITNVCRLLECRNWLSKGAFIYIERDSLNSNLAHPKNWQIHRSNKSGNVNYHLFRKTY